MVDGRIAKWLDGLAIELSSHLTMTYTAGRELAHNVRLTLPRRFVRIQLVALLSIAQSH